MLDCVSKPLALSPGLQHNPCTALMGSSVCQVPAWLCHFTISVSTALAQTSKRRENGHGGLWQVSAVPTAAGAGQVSAYFGAFTASQSCGGGMEGQMKACRHPGLELFPRDAWSQLSVSVPAPLRALLPILLFLLPQNC